MNNFRQTIATVTIGIFFLIACVSIGWPQEQPGKPDYNWLNGKWEGLWEFANANDGQLEMDLQVVNDNQIKGPAVIKRTPRTQKRGVTSHTSVSGSVNGNEVELVIAPGTASAGRTYKLSYVDGVLKGSRGGKEQIFNKN